MKIVKKRKVIKLGNSLAITIPSLFWRFNEITSGDEVLIEGDEKMLKLKVFKHKKKVAQNQPND